MPLTSQRFFVFCIALAIAIPVGLMILSRQESRKPRWDVTFLLGVLLAQAAAVGAVAVSVNRDYGIYPSWSSLWGTPSAPPVVVAGARLGLHALVGTRRPLLPLTFGSASDIGRYQTTTVKGAQSGISQRVVTWTPPQYHDRRYAKARFPVVMVLGGAEVHIQLVIDRLNFAATASREIRSGRVAPFVAVFPEINVAMPVQTECTNYPGGPQAFTWLSQDVRNWATSKLRISGDGRRWAVMGWSTGGYCAALLHLREPAHFGAAASVEGYYAPEPGGGSGNLRQLLRTHPTLANESSPTWLIQHRPPARIQLLVMSSNKDPQSYPQAKQFMRRMQNVPGVQPYIVKDVGHSLDTYQAVLAPILGWMATVSDT